MRFLCSVLFAATVSAAGLVARQQEYFYNISEFDASSSQNYGANVTFHLHQQYPNETVYDTTCKIGGETLFTALWTSGINTLSACTNQDFTFSFVDKYGNGTAYRLCVISNIPPPIGAEDFAAYGTEDFGPGNFTFVNTGDAGIRYIGKKNFNIPISFDRTANC